MARAGHSAACLRQSGFGQELFDVLVSVVAFADFHQTGKMEFHPSFDLTRWNVVTTRFQTFRQLFGTAEHAHRLATDIHLEKKRFALTGFHAIDLCDDRMSRAPFSGGCLSVSSHFLLMRNLDLWEQRFHPIWLKRLVGKRTCDGFGRPFPV